MKYIIHVYDYKAKPCKSITPLNESNVMHGEQKIYTYAHKCKPTNIESTNVRGWNHIASRMYENGQLVMEEAYTYKMFDITYTRNPELVKYTVRFEYKHGDVCIVSSFINDYLIERITKVRGVLHGPRDIYVRDFDNMRKYGTDYVLYKHYDYVDGKKHGPIIFKNLDGSVYKSFAYEHGLKHGEYKEYYDTGELHIEFTYNHGECCGKQYCYGKNGILQSMTDYSGDPPYIGYIYCTDGETVWIKSETNQKNYPCESQITSYDWEGNARDTYTTHYEKHVVEKSTIYYYDGQLYNTVRNQPALTLPTQIRLSKIVTEHIMHIT